jgi:hypothetical protein
MFFFFVAQSTIFFSRIQHYVIWQKIWIRLFFFLHQNQNIFFINIKWSVPKVCNISFIMFKIIVFFVIMLFSQLYICMWRLQFYTHVESICTTAPFHSSSLAKGYEKGDPNRNPWLAKMCRDRPFNL